ncbi:MAG: GNAT family N-acetyltransferase [Gammaproteobacteria bacterium]|nr:GNAT family N-acetyltransferase [Gammaproteobacteria bacterium]
MRIIEDDLQNPDVVRLLREHLQHVASLSPPGSVHALDVQALQSPAVTLWTAWEEDELLGCGALQELTTEHAEIKSMRTATAHLGTGVASAIMRHLIDEARSRGYVRLSLETGSAAEFTPAQSLYRKFGFRFCEPFGAYQEDPYSRFMTRSI